MRLQIAAVGQVIGLIVFLLSGFSAIVHSAPTVDGDELPPSDPTANDFDQLNLESLLDTVVTATKRQQTIEEAPSTIEVINAENIRRHGFRTVGEALRSVPGLAIIDDHTYWNIGVRGLFGGAGTASDIVKVMINSQPISFRSTSGNFFGNELIPIEAVKQIEIIRGPGSALYGANAFLGIINIVTFDGSESNGGAPRQSLTLNGIYRENESNQTLDGGGSFVSAWESDRFRYLVTGNYFYGDRSGLTVPGLPDMVDGLFYQTNPSMYPPAKGYPSPGWDRPAREKMMKSSPSRNDLERVGSLYAIVSTGISNRIRLFLDGNFQYFDKFGEFQDFSYLTHKNRITHNNGFVRARFLLEPEDEQGFSLNASVALAGGRPTGNDHLLDPMAPGTSMKRLFGYLAADGVLEASYAFSKDHVLSLGVDYSNDREDLLSLELVNEQTNEKSYTTGFGEKTFANLGFYSQWIFYPIKELGLTLGTRFDHNSAIACNSQEWDCPFSMADQVQNGTTVKNRGAFQISNRAAIVYALPVANLYAKLIYGSSFKPPSPYQLYHEPINITGSQGSPTLKPQTADTVEALVGYKPFEGLHLSVDFFYTTVTDMVVFFKELGFLEGRNADVTTYGLEGSLSYSWKNWLTTFVKVSYLINPTIHPKQKDGETDFSWQLSPLNKDLPVGMYPDLMLNFGINLFFPESNLNISLSGYYVGKRRASLINTQLYSSADLNKSYDLNPYFIADLTLSSVGLRWIGKNETTISLSLRNVPGHYVEPGYGGIDIPALGPECQLRIQQQF